ncbi:MAG: flagellar motor protein MotB [Lachnospiraceae bacterium]|nr:flagellar motor protein MotB [Lachnospiraceae bacterium]
MAFKKKPDPPKSFPLWQSTFSDLMNLLLCFFVLLFSMSTIEQDKLEQVAASINNAFSIMSNGGSTVSDGKLVSAGINQLPDVADYFGDSLSRAANDNGDNPKGADSASGDAAKKNDNSEDAEKEVEQKALEESEKMAEQVTESAKRYGIQDRVQVDFNGQYVRLTLNGAFLFDTGQSEVKKAARPIIRRVAHILNSYKDSLIEVEGYTDNVPIHSSKYEDNNVLSMYRALNVANDIRKYSKLDPSNIYSSGRGEYNPVASNKTPEGRARNRRVEIKIYNSYNSKR